MKELRKIVIKATGPMLITVLLVFIISLVFTFTRKSIIDVIFSVCLGIEAVIIAMMFIVEVVYDGWKNKK